MPGNFKPCPNCGAGNIIVEGMRHDAPVFCEECGEERTLEEWRADTAREKILRARLLAAEELIEALENEHSAYFDTLHRTHDVRDKLERHKAAKEAVESAKAKLEAICPPK